MAGRTGASAEGLDALQPFFRSLPGHLRAAYVVIVHPAPDLVKNPGTRSS